MCPFLVFVFLFSIFYFLLFPIPRAVDHGGEDGNQLRGFVFKRLNNSRVDRAFFTQKFKPQSGFVRFLDRSTQLRDKLRIGSSPRRLSP